MTSRERASQILDHGRTTAADWPIQQSESQSYVPSAPDAVADTAVGLTVAKRLGATAPGTAAAHLQKWSRWGRKRCPRQSEPLEHLSGGREAGGQAATAIFHGGLAAFRYRPDITLHCGRPSALDDPQAGRAASPGLEPQGHSRRAPRSAVCVWREIRARPRDCRCCYCCCRRSPPLLAKSGRDY